MSGADEASGDLPGGAVAPPSGPDEASPPGGAAAPRSIVAVFAVEKLRNWRPSYTRLLTLTLDGFATFDPAEPATPTNSWAWSQLVVARPRASEKGGAGAFVLHCKGGAAASGGGMLGSGGGSGRVLKYYFRVPVDARALVLSELHRVRGVALGYDRDGGGAGGGGADANSGSGANGPWIVKREAHAAMCFL